MHAMAKAMDPGMTTRELDAIGRTLLDRAGATFCMGQVTAAQTKLCRDGKRAMELGIAQVGASKPLGGIDRGPLIVTLPGRT